MIAATLVAGGSYAARESAIASLIEARNDATATCAVVLEGLPDGRDTLAARLGDRAPQHVVRLPPGCPCCAGNLVIRVTLDRILRRQPAHLYLGIGQQAHLERVRHFLTQPRYAAWLTLTDDCTLAA